MAEADRRTQIAKAKTYIHRIKSVSKKTYARAYLDHLLTEGASAEPDRGALSYMAAQAVRIELRRILKEFIA